MRTLVKAGLLSIVMGLLLFAVDVTADDPHSSFSTAPARLFMGSDQNPLSMTAGTMRRFDTGFSATVLTFVTPNTAQTLWAAIFNRPEHCTNPVMDSSGPVSNCSSADFSNPKVQASVVWVTGGSIDSTGLLSLNGQLGIGPGGLPGPVNFGGGLTNPKGAEIHLVVRDHGPVDGPQDFTTFQPNGNPLMMNQAANIQFFVFRP